MSNKLVSILIPAYNRAQYIETAIESALSQSYKNIEVIIYDDGSTDNTINVLSKYEGNKKIIIIKNNNNKGVGYARNKLLANASGDYLCWLDSDDIMHKDRINILLEEIQANDSDIIYSKIQWFSGTSKISYGDFITADVSKYDKNDWGSLHSNTVCATGFFKRDLIKYKFVEDLLLGGEDVLWLWSILQDDVKISYSNKCLYFYRRHNDRIGNIKRKEENIELKKNENIKINNYIKNI